MPSISVPTAIIGASAIGAGTAIYGASQQASAAKQAAQAQTQSAQLATNTEQNMFNQVSGYEQPFISGGQGAYSTLNQLLGTGGGDSTSIQNTLNNLPGYQFTLNQGLKSVQNSAAARGLGDSGAALKGAANYATGLANSNYGGYVTGLQNSANTGASAANSLAGFGTTTAGQIGANQIGAGNAQAGASIAGGNAAANAANGIGGSAVSLAQYYTLNNLLKSTNSASGGGTDGLGYVAVTPNQLTGQYAGSY